MRPGRLLLCMLVAAGGVGASVLMLGHLSHMLHPFALRPSPIASRPVAGTAHPHRTAKIASRVRSVRVVARARVRRSQSSGSGGSLALLERVGLECAAGAALIGVLAMLLVGRRVRRRSRRGYALYELHLSTHDQAKGQDLEDMVESIANIVRAWPAERVRHGQPYLALELICGTAPTAGGELEMEWSINIRCEPQSVSALDGAISAAYPDVRVGRRHGEQPRPRAGVLREPGCVMRFRKERSFVYSLIADNEEQASSPLEQIARAQVAVCAPSMVRFQLTPTPSFFEELARRLYRRHENKLVRQERWGLPEGGLMSTFNRAEMRAAERTQNRSLFWLEAVVAADSREACKTVAAAVQSRRGENRLHRRWMALRQGLYRRRFPGALGPLIPSFRSLVSAAEVAHLLELPSARMKGVPVRRVTIPRIPAAPEIVRGHRARSVGPGHPDRAGAGARPRPLERPGAMTAAARPPSAPCAEDLYPMLRAENAEVLIHPDDRKYGALLVGGQGCGKSSALLAFYLNDVMDEDAAPIVIDPKSELARVCLRLTPPDCGKRVWFLDLGRPAFGMSPLRLIGDRPLAIEAAQLAENVVAALLDINENQIYQSSRRYLYHAVIGAIAIANKQTRRARLEDVYTLLRPAKDEFRGAVAEACADQPDLDQTAEFFRSELPDDLRMATSRVAERMDAPRNKISGLTGVPPLRRFFNHPSDVPLREIIQARDILIVDANMGAIGTENSKACMLFILRMLHAQLQRQVHLPEADRPRVPLLVDEAHYVAGGENVVDQIATHRAAGLEPAFGLQYLAQLGSASEHQQKILKGVLNLLQSRFLFRMGDAEDAEQATRIAMAVYATMIRDDPDSRARLRVTPEQALNFPNYYCLASWIANGTRVPSFMGQTYPLPDAGDEWADKHLAAQDERVGPYPEQLESTLPIDAAPASEEPTGRTPGMAIAPPREAPEPATPPADSNDDPAPAADQPAKHEVKVDYEPPPEKGADLADSPIRQIVGRRIPGHDVPDGDRPASDTLRELAFLDRINEIGPADLLDGASRLPRLYDEDYAVLALLDRVGLAPSGLIGRAALPGRASRSVADRLIKLYRHGLIARHTTGLREHTRTDGKPPQLYSLARRGLQVAQERKPAPAISPRREWRAIEQPHAGRLAHDLHALGWAIEFHRVVGELATDRWRTPRYATGRYPVPQVGSGQRRHPITLNEINVPDGQSIIDVELKSFTEIKPDLSLELRVEPQKLMFDLLVELDLTARPSYNRDKFLAYDAFLCGWALAHPRYRAQGTRPAVVFVCPNTHAALACAREADELMTGRIGVMGSPAEQWYYASRDHLFFAIEADIHRGNLAALALPAQPPGLRERLSGEHELAVQRVCLLTV